MAAGFPQDNSQEDGDGDDNGQFEPQAFEPQGIDMNGPVDMKGLISMFEQFQQNFLKNIELMI